MEKDKGRAITVTSGKGGTGKTTTVAAIAAHLASLGHKTLCIDCDIGLKNLDIALGMSNLNSADFIDCVQGRLTLEQAAVHHPRIVNLDFLSAPTKMIKAENVDTDKMRMFIDRVKDEYEYCIIDSPAGLGDGFRLAACGADMAIIVATCDMSSMRDGQMVSAELNDMGVKNIRLLVNRVKPKLYKKMRATVDGIIDSVGARLIGLVAEDENVILAANSGTPLMFYESKRASAQYLRIAKRIAGEKIPLGKI